MLPQVGKTLLRHRIRGTPLRLLFKSVTTCGHRSHRLFVNGSECRLTKGKRVHSLVILLRRNFLQGEGETLTNACFLRRILRSVFSVRMGPGGKTNRLPFVRAKHVNLKEGSRRL